MIKRIFHFFLFAIVFLSCKIEPNIKTDNKMPDQVELTEQHLDWFRDAKFGMFIHWGPYSMLAGEWNNMKLPVGKNSEWIMKEFAIPVNEYRELAHSFNPEGFDANEWVKLAKETGMKYIVITAKHHDGFAMYHSGVSSYNIFDWTSFKRDPLKELSKACSEEGIKFCVYYSHREDWDHPGGYGNNWDYDNDWGADHSHHEKFEQYLEEKAKPQLHELLTNYGPVGLVWFDRGMYTPEQGKEFVKLVHDKQPLALINGRVGHYNQEMTGDYQSMSDNGIPPGGLEQYWETPQTLNETWGFSKFDTLWKSPETVIRRLVEIVSRGGNYLLNIGPDGNGKIPEATVKIFREAGSWIERNGESIYGTTANPFGELPWGYCTAKGNKLYLFVRDWPRDAKLILAGIENSVTSTYLLKNRTTILSVKKEEDQIQIDLPSEAPDNPLSVLVMELDRAPVINRPIVLQDEKGSIELNYLTVKTSGKTLTCFNRKGGFHISNWNGPDDTAEWIAEIERPGKFRVDIIYAANKECKGKQFEIITDDLNIKHTVICTGDWYEYRKFPVGFIEKPAAGKFTLSVRPVSMSETNLMYLHSILLTPVTKIKKNGWSVNIAD